MSGHQTETCPKPRPAKRWQNALWVCPTCDRAWVLRYSMRRPPHRHDEAPTLRYEMYAWGWWPWTPPSSEATE